jgi:trehalose 6-phosphate synthase
MRQRILVAANRGPLSYEFGADGTLIGRRGGGGLVAGLTSGLAELPPECDVLWVCSALSDADRAAASQQDQGRDRGWARGWGSGRDRDQGDIPVRMLDIPPDTFHRAYNNMANSTLWFLHHLLFDLPDQPRFGQDFRRDWAAYQAFNEAFADALAEETADAAPGTVRVLVQDYQLTLAPRMLREKLGDRAAEVGIAYFWHTPWAPADYYRLLPGEAAEAMLVGILGADHAGFHSARWADAFLECCALYLGAEIDRSVRRGPVIARVAYRGHVTEVATHPLGVDAAELRESARADAVETQVATLREVAGGRQLIVRVDRTELSKNILRGLAAYRELLATRPGWRGRVVHLAFAYPSRSALPEYRAYTDRMQREAAEINAEFGTDDWTPLVLEVKDDYARSLAACRVADVLLINPVRDGMNLVAQEGPVLSERGCALVLSREAGAAELLAGDALLVNPYDVSETAAALDQALVMPQAERQRRSAAMAAATQGRAPARWLAEQLAAIS